MYSFPQEREDTPYRIKIPIDVQFGQSKVVSLGKIKEHMPKKGNNYRFFFKCVDSDGQEYFDEESDENAFVPSFGSKIIVQCRREP